MKKLFLFLVCLLAAAVMCSCAEFSGAGDADTTDAVVDINPKDDDGEDADKDKDDEDKDSDDETSGDDEESSETGDSTDADAADTSAAETGKPDVPSQAGTSAVTACEHPATHLINQKAASCSSQGYTGDAQCNACGAIIARGAAIPVTPHKNTEVRNRREATTASEGYTGDTYCRDCGAKLYSGTSIARLTVKYSHTFGDGTVLEYDEAQKDQLFINTVKKAGKSAAHGDAAAEKAILNAVNAERQKAGVAPLQWCEEAYYFANVRSKEIVSTFRHTRPDGRKWSTVYDDAHIAWNIGGENIGSFTARDNIASVFMNAWMQSAGHRSNILNPNYKYLTVSVYTDGKNVYAVQNFFG